MAAWITLSFSKRCLVQLLSALQTHTSPAMSSDAAGLLLNRGASPPADERKGGKRKIPDKSERRTKLRDDDSVAKLLFQPWGQELVARP